MLDRYNIERLSKPVVGFRPTIEFELEGERMDPEV
jgi:hypothetical protein